MTIVMSNVRLSYGTAELVRGINITIADGEFYALLGAPGSGKSAIIACLAGLTPPDDGTVRVGAEDRATGRSTGVVLQSVRLDPGLTVRQTLVLHARFHGFKARQQDSRLTTVAAGLGLTDLLNHRVKQLTADEARRTDIARALIHQPPVLLLDEPFRDLGPASTDAVWQALADLYQHGTTIVLATDQANQAERADRVGLLAAGQIVAQDSPDRLAAGVGQPVLAMRLSDPAACRDELAGYGIELPAADADGLVRWAVSPEQARDVIAVLSDRLYDFEYRNRSLQEAFEELSRSPAPVSDTDLKTEFRGEAEFQGVIAPVWPAEAVVDLTPATAEVPPAATGDADDVAPGDAAADSTPTEEPAVDEPAVEATDDDTGYEADTEWADDAEYTDDAEYAEWAEDAEVSPESPDEPAAEATSPVTDDIPADTDLELDDTDLDLPDEDTDLAGTPDTDAGLSPDEVPDEAPEQYEEPYEEASPEEPEEPEEPVAPPPEEAPVVELPEGRWSRAPRFSDTGRTSGTRRRPVTGEDPAKQLARLVGARDDSARPARWRLGRRGPIEVSPSPDEPLVPPVEPAEPAEPEVEPLAPAEEVSVPDIPAPVEDWPDTDADADQLPDTADVGLADDETLDQAESFAEPPEPDDTDDQVPEADDTDDELANQTEIFDDEQTGDQDDEQTEAGPTPEDELGSVPLDETAGFDPYYSAPLIMGGHLRTEPDPAESLQLTGSAQDRLDEVSRLVKSALLRDTLPSFDETFPSDILPPVAPPYVEPTTEPLTDEEIWDQEMSRPIDETLARQARVSLSVEKRLEEARRRRASQSEEAG